MIHLASGAMRGIWSDLGLDTGPGEAKRLAKIGRHKKTRLVLEQWPRQRRGLGHRLGCPNPMYQGLDSPRPWTHEIATDLHRT